MVEQQNVITVNKTATAAVTANFVKISVSVFGEAKKYAEAIDAADGAASKLCDAFAAKLKNDVKLYSGGINVNAVRSDKKIVGYRAARAFTAEFDFDGKLLNSVLDVLGALALDWHVSFTFKDNGERKKLLANAVAAAKSDAEVIADAAGVKLGGLCRVDYSAGDSVRPVMMRMAFDGGANSAAEPEQITLSESVSCSYFFEKK